MNNGAATHEEYGTNAVKLMRKSVKLMKQQHVALQGHTSSVTLYYGDKILKDYILTDTNNNCRRFYGEHP